MSHLIDKDALVAEIERRINEEIQSRVTDLGYSQGRVDSIRNVLSIIDTLEVKEVDLEKEIEEHVLGMPMSEFTNDGEVEDYLDWARKEFRHFFELGLKAQKG